MMALLFEIQIEEHIDSEWEVWFDGFTISHETDGTTLLKGSVIDQATLHGLLMRINQLGLALVRAEQIKKE